MVEVFVKRREMRHDYSSYSESDSSSESGSSNDSCSLSSSSAASGDSDGESEQFWTRAVAFSLLCGRKFFRNECRIP